MSLAAGTLLDNRYEVIRPLGEGGMGAAYLVEHRVLGQQLVAKATTRHEKVHRKQFEQEARMLANLEHPNLPRVTDFFVHEKQPYLIMQYVDGSTLDRLKEGRSAPFEVDQVLRWANDLLDALDYLHSQEPPIIHRDIKPPNVCIKPDGRAVLLDFGIARRLDRTSTHVGAQAHSAFYSPIEQYLSERDSAYEIVRHYFEELRAAGIHTGPYSDIYSLGATLYFALTLLEPADPCWRIIEEGLTPIQKRNREVPEFLAAAIERALILDPRERCQTAAEMRQLLQPVRPDTDPAVLRPRRRQPLPIRDVTALEHELIYIPAGEFQMGSDDLELKSACRPQHVVDLLPFCIARLPVTNAQYQRFIDNSEDYPVPFSPMRFAQRYSWDKRTRTYPRGLEDHPVVLVTLEDALAYCRWLSDVSGLLCRLPSEAEWEKAACWDSKSGRSRRYPWGDQFDENCANVDTHGALRLETSPAGYYSPAGDSAFGLGDMAGNVWEWTGSFYWSYPYDPAGDRENLDIEGERVVRGGAYDEGSLAARSGWRNGVRPGLALAKVGFRVACDAA